MSATVTIGSWAIPALVSLAAFIVANVAAPAPRPSSYFPDIGHAIMLAAVNGLAVIVSLVAWLIWSLA